MTSTPGRPTPDGDEDGPGGPAQPEDTTGVQLGMSDGESGTFEPEEDPVEDVEP